MPCCVPLSLPGWYMFSIVSVVKNYCSTSRVYNMTLSYLILPVLILTRSFEWNSLL